jgi:type II secretory pathway pseudopilin PulG
MEEQPQILREQKTKDTSLNSYCSIRCSKTSEQGYMLVAVIFLVALLTLSLSVALPKISKQIQRDRELETMNRGKQYIRGIKMYYKTFHAYPPNVDALIKPTNNVRFLRKKYADPTTGKEDWKPVRFGQNKAPTAMGLFGQPLTGSSIAGTGPGAQSNGFNPSSNSAGNSASNQSDTTASQTGSTQAGSNNPNSGGGSSNGTDTGQNGQTFGGAAIIGFSPNSPNQSIMVYKTKSHYNEWEFVYDPQVDQMQQMGINPANGGGVPGLGGTSGIGGTPGIGGTSSGGMPGTGSATGVATPTSN